MDTERAKKMSSELIGKVVCGWKIISYRGSGKSALVFLAEKDGQKTALKIFDPELVQRFGEQTQLSRIDRECALIGKLHPNLVEIYDGGLCEDSGYLFVAMKYLEARDLEVALSDIPHDKIANIIQQVAAAAKFLEECELAHRDIKPSNIAVTDNYEQAILLDLGVLRPFGDPGLTDADSRPFIGTLRYSSPEFLTRSEKPTPEGWRAITFYQLGGVLHDLIMRRPLFDEFSEPYAVLVEAVKSEQPQIYSDKVSPNLVVLAQNCLVKSPEARLDLVSWDDFLNIASPKESAQRARDRVRKRSLAARVASDTSMLPRQNNTPLQLARQLIAELSGIIRLECAGNSSFPRMEIIEHKQEPLHVRVVFDSSLPLCVPRPLSVRFRINLIDEPTMAVNIIASACLLNQNSEHPDPLKERDLFSGPLDSPSLAISIQDILYAYLDKVQSSNQEVLAAGGPYWLDIDETIEGEK